ncbi:MAG: hypothetical protein AB8B74_10200 [Crocinitomicaceae bacterium]
MTARRNIKDQQNYQQQQNSANNFKSNIGKTTISKVNKKELKNGEFSSYEEVD